MNLLQGNDIEQAARGFGWKNLNPGIRALWTAPLRGEEGAPRHRIIHARLMQAGVPARLERLGFRSAPGYHKCGSRQEIDRVTAFRLLVWRGDRWEVVLEEDEVSYPRDGDPAWFDIPGIVTPGAIVELRRCEIDGWWTSWNLAEGAVLLEGEVGRPAPGREGRLSVGQVDLSSMPAGVGVERLPGEVRYRTSSFEIGFWLGRPGFSFLGLDELEEGRTGRNLLRTHPAITLQGPRYHPVGGLPCIAPLLHGDISGTVSVRGGAVVYDFQTGPPGQEYVLEWNVEERRIVFHFTRRSGAAVRAWESSFWTMVFSSEVTPTTALGDITREGEAGILSFPILLHAPGHGTLRLACEAGGGACRSDSCRPLACTSLELKAGDEAQPEGDYVLPAGVHRLNGEMGVFRVSIDIPAGTPRHAAGALRSCAVTALTYRADTATLTNNGNSIHAPLCMDLWSSVANRIDRIAPELRATTLLRDSLQRWLDGGPGYASGGMSGARGIHLAEDEFIMTGTAGLLGLAEFLERSGTVEWLDLYRAGIARQLELMRRRDVDGDGLVESVYRDGVSGGHQWSTNWYDVVSFGWKDAFSNALLYRALVVLSEVFPRLRESGLGTGLAEWAERLRRSYEDAFFNPRTGWLAGWRCRKGLLHDYAFLSVNGAAVCAGVLDSGRAQTVVSRLWDEAQRIGLPDPRLGLPGNLWPVPDSDMVPLMHGKPMGYYINGGLTHSQSRHYVGALYRVGMTREADSILDGLCGSLADGTAFGGCNSGIDWRYWDGAPCGYEGILTDQFGVLAVVVDRYCRPGVAEWR